MCFKWVKGRKLLMNGWISSITITFCSGPRSKCLDDPPRISLPGFTGTSITGRELPGVVFDGDAQCKFLYGEGYRRCYQLRVSSTS